MQIEMKIRGLMMDPVTNMPIVILRDLEGNSVLPIWVGVYEANAIALEIEKVTTPRPMTHDLIKNLLMGLGGALYAHAFQFIVPGIFEPVAGSFLVWVMLITGGSGNNRGALVGAATVWAIWSVTEILASRLPAEFATQFSAARLALIGVFVIAVLLIRPEGLLPEVRSRAPDNGRKTADPVR